MGGIGKTELVLQYAISCFNQQLYPGGVCWLRARDQEIATQIISFAKANLGIKPPDKLETKEKVKFIWQRWPEGDSLVIVDDVTDYAAIDPYLPPASQKFKILITTRINLGSSVTQIEIEKLTDQAAIKVLKAIVGKDRIESQLTSVKTLCQKVGNLPLGLELLGRFLARKLDWSVQKLIERLESKKLEAKALIETESGMTARLGIAAALELSWVELNDAEQKLACLLGMFSVAPISWHLVEMSLSKKDTDCLEELRDEGLIDNSLLKRVGQGTYQLHQIIQEFFRIKLNERTDKGESLKKTYCKVMIGFTKDISDIPTIDEIDELKKTIPHLEEMINHWISYLADEDLIWAFEGIGRFYEGQGDFSLSLFWRRKGVNQTQKKLSAKNPDYLRSLRHLGLFYLKLGNDKEAQPLLEKVFEEIKDSEEEGVLGIRLRNDLGALYFRQERFSKAESFYNKALELSQKSLFKENSDIASILNNLAKIHEKKGLSEKAKSLYDEALNLEEIGDFNFAQILDNLGNHYNMKKQYREAEPYFEKSLKIRKSTLGEKHLKVAESLSNTADNYFFQGRFQEAAKLFKQSAAIYEELFDCEYHKTVEVKKSLEICDLAIRFWLIRLIIKLRLCF
ncbi:TPR repeat domain protein, putative [Acaryochloris marina MBIC11017]|uniref:TPR repeat domain protein, putative n=2 Tax=Acaryochloris marina TaxID=155978 RepID=B0C1B8_ACAM1|nr:TPR repeat domain protein, putative [Acaryochloris marina MBIC11017]BDM78553.1 hypothetical protein AM10699_14220 [Acaryochloris marina MBIC10699]